MRVKARKAPSAKLRQAARKNIAKAHIARFRTREPRSIGRVRPARRGSSRQLRMREVRRR